MERSCIAANFISLIDFYCEFLLILESNYLAHALINGNLVLLLDMSNTSSRQWKVWPKPIRSLVVCWWCQTKSTSWVPGPAATKKLYVHQELM